VFYVTGPFSHFFLQISIHFLLQVLQQQQHQQQQQQQQQQQRQQQPLTKN
jgi:hypothetical protein